MDQRTVIVGGGISGLALAHALKAKGRSVVLLESNPRLGGAIQTRQRDGFLLETGPNGFLPGEPAMTRLLTSLELTPRLQGAAPSARLRFIYTRGKLRSVPTSPPAFFKSDLIPLSARLRVFGDLFARRSAERDETLTSFAGRHFGKTTADVVIDAVQSGIFAGDSTRLSLPSAFPKLAELERKHRSLILGMIRREKAGRGNRKATDPPPAPLLSFEGGLSTMISALGKSLGSDVRLGSELIGLSRTRQGWSLAVSQASGQMVLEADRVVLAIPAYAAARLLKPIDAGLSGELDSISYAPVAVVQLGYPKAALSGLPEGFGFLVPFEEGRRLLGALFISSVFPWRSPEGQFLITCMMGGARRPELLSLNDEALIGLATEELKEMTGVAASPTLREVIRWQRAIPQYNLGHQDRLERIDRALSRLPGLYLTGNAYRGVGMNDCVRRSEELAQEF